MKRYYLGVFLGLIAIVLFTAYSLNWASSSAPANNLIAPEALVIPEDTIPSSQEFTIDYDSYLRWRDMAKVLYQSGDPKAYKLYQKLVSYMEQYNRKDPAFDSDVMTEDLKASFATLDNPSLQVQIDSLLYYHAFPTLYDPAYSSPLN